MPLQSQDPNQSTPASPYSGLQGIPSGLMGLMTSKLPGGGGKTIGSQQPPISDPTANWAPAAQKAGLQPSDIQYLQQQLQQLTQSEQPGAPKIESGTGYATQKTDPGGGATQQQTPDALTQGLGMFFSQYLAPLMQQQNQQNMGMISGWGQAMSQAEQQALPPGVKQFFQTTSPQIQQLMGLQNTADMAQSAGAIPFQQLMGNMQQNTAGLQALMDAFTKAATYQELGAGSPVQLGNLLSGQLQGLPVASGLAQLLGGSSNSLGGSTPTPATPAVSAALANQQAQAGSTPTVTPQP